MKEENYTHRIDVMPPDWWLTVDETFGEFALTIHPIGASIVIPSHETGKRIQAAFKNHNTDLDRAYRRSLAFRWQRFWYLKRKRKARQ